MKIFIASDLHGSADYCRQMIEAFTFEKADKLLLLGDILYHGPRNDLPANYSPKAVLYMLESIKDKIICVGGNCDAEIDREILPFRVIPDYGSIFCDGLNIYFAHGHKGEPPLEEGDIYITGHTHVPLNAVENGHYHLNPGSLSIPKENSKQGYIVYENRKFIFKDLGGYVLDVLELEEKCGKADEKVEEAEKPSVASKNEEKPRVHLPRIMHRKRIVKKK